MTTEKRIICDNDDCNGGKYMQICGNKHHICSLCLIDGRTDDWCPICLNNAKLKDLTEEQK